MFVGSFLHVCEEGRWHVIQNPLEPQLIISHLKTNLKTNRFPISLTRQENKCHCWRTPYETNFQ